MTQYNRNKCINLKLKVWRQKGEDTKGRFESYDANDISIDMSFLEMLDVVNEGIILSGKDPIAFDNDCREGICGTCGAMVDGRAHGPKKGTTLCQLHMRNFSNGATVVIEPWRSRAFKVIKDLVVDRSAFDKIIQAGGYISVNTGGAPDGNAIPIPQDLAEKAMDAASCIGCGACVAACPNASAMLFTGSKISQYALLPQGQAETRKRVIEMSGKMDKLGFGNCSNESECEAVCPKEISIVNIARMNREYLKSFILSK